MTIPSELEFSEFWIHDREWKIAFLERNSSEAAVLALRAEHRRQSLAARNLELWTLCKVQGIRAADIKAYFGGDIGNIRRCLNRTGIVPQSWLCLALELADVDPQEWLLAPRPHHETVGLMQTVTAYRHLHETTNSEVVRVANQPGLGGAARLPLKPLELPHAALMRSVCCDLDNLEEWLLLGSQVAFDFRRLQDAPALRVFLQDVNERAQGFLDPNDTASLNLLQSWSPGTATPEVVLGQVAVVWNPWQLYWYLVEDAIAA